MVVPFTKERTKDLTIYAANEDLLKKSITLSYIDYHYAQAARCAKVTLEIKHHSIEKKHNFVIY